MDCVSCETVLRDALDAVPSIKVHALSHKTGKMTLEYTSKDDRDKLNAILTEHDYSLSEHKEASQQWSSLSPDQRIEQFAIWAWIFTLLRVFMQFDLTKYIWEYWPNMWLWVAFLVWLVACGSSCLAVTGWIVVSYVEALEDKNWSNLLKTQGLFHAWRMAAFIWWWALLWYVGQSFQISPTFNAVLMMIVGLILAYVWLQIFWFVPSITKRWFHLPGGTEKIIKKLNDPKYALVVWALTFFLPCWFTQSMQLFAMQTGSAVQWALILWAYWLWTIPLLLWLWMSAGYFKSKMKMFNKVVAWLLIAFGLMTFWNGYTAMNGWTGSPSEQWIVQATIEPLTWSHLWNRLEPMDILLASNKSYQITIDPLMNGIWCKSIINLPDGTRHAVQQWVPITFAFNPVQAGTYRLTCSTWSNHWTIVVQG